MTSRPAHFIVKFCRNCEKFSARDFSRTGKEMPKVTPKGNTGSAKGKGKGAQVFQLINLI